MAEIHQKPETDHQEYYINSKEAREAHVHHVGEGIRFQVVVALRPCERCATRDPHVLEDLGTPYFIHIEKHY